MADNRLDFPLTVYVNEDGMTRVMPGGYNDADFRLDFGDEVEFIGVANRLDELVMLIQSIN